MLRPSVIDPIVRAALKEDVGPRDLTTTLLIPKNRFIKADIRFHEKGVLCGIEIAERVFRILDEDLRFLPVAKDGEEIEEGREIAYLEGEARSILIAERTALNFLGYLSGISTLTRAFVEKVKGTGAQILDTRKTTPTLRAFEKYAVKTGGGINHRLGLYDQILIKDNHLRILLQEPLLSIIERARSGSLKRAILGVEVKNLKEFQEVLKSSANYILLDNMTPATVREAVALFKKSCGGVIPPPLEVSGGITLDNVREYAEAGAQRISIGCLTHSAPAIDVSLDIVG